MGSFNITQLGDTGGQDRKDTNFRGLTIFNNVLYYSKGSGGNGVNTVYFIDTTGTVCTGTIGVGLPQSGAALPTAGIDYTDVAAADGGRGSLQHVHPEGLPHRTALKPQHSFPFGIWFANANTVYVADEGNGDNTYSTTTGTYTKAASQTTAGLQKWVFNSTARVEACLYLASRFGTGRAIHRRWLSNRKQFRRPDCPGRRPPMACVT